MKKKITVIPLIMVSVLIVLAVGMMSAVYADASGTYNGIQWTYTAADQTLSFSGMGEIPTTDEEAELPWKEYENQIQKYVIPSGFTKLGMGVVRGDNVELVQIPYDIELAYDPTYSDYDYDDWITRTPFYGCYRSKVKIEVTGTSDVLSSEPAKLIGEWGYYLYGYGWSMKTVMPEYEYDWNDDQEHADNGTIFIEKKYTGKKLKPAPVIRDQFGNVLKKGVDYTLSYSNNINVGTAWCTATGMGEFYGKAKLRFVIYPKGTSITKVVPARKAFTVKWLKQSKKMKTKHIKGYIVQYSRNKNFYYPGTKTKLVKGYKKTSLKIKGLKAKKTYYVRVQTYYEDSKDQYRAIWSKKMKVKTK